MMLQSIDQSQPVHSLMSYPSISRPISGTEPSPHEIWSMLNQRLDTLAGMTRNNPAFIFSSIYSIFTAKFDSGITTTAKRR
jgi:hypothetical protein